MNTIKTMEGENMVDFDKGAKALLDDAKKKRAEARGAAPASPAKKEKTKEELDAEAKVKAETEKKEKEAVEAKKKETEAAQAKKDAYFQGEDSRGRQARYEEGA